MEHDKSGLAMIGILLVVAVVGLVQMGAFSSFTSDLTGNAVKLNQDDYVQPVLNMQVDEYILRMENGDRVFHAETLNLASMGQVEDILFHTWKHGRIVETRSAREENLLMEHRHRSQHSSRLGYTYSADFTIEEFDMMDTRGLVFTFQVETGDGSVGNHVRIDTVKPFVETTQLSEDRKQTGVYTHQ